MKAGVVIIGMRGWMEMDLGKKEKKTLHFKKNMFSIV